MSSKSDRDNRSNQLNSNNDAYYSSRGSERGGGGGDDDEDGAGRRGLDVSEELSRHFAREEHIRYMRERDRPEIGSFIGVAVGLDGTTAFIPMQFTADPFMGLRDSARSRNEDVAEVVVGAIGRQLAARWGCPLALLTTVDSDGKDMFWTGYQYPAGCGGAHRVRNEQLWKEIGEQAVADARALLGRPADLRQLLDRPCRQIKSDPELARTWNHDKLTKIAEQLISDHFA